MAAHLESVEVVAVRFVAPCERLVLCITQNPARNPPNMEGRPPDGEPVPRPAQGDLGVLQPHRYLHLGARCPSARIVSEQVRCQKDQSDPLPGRRSIATWYRFGSSFRSQPQIRRRSFVMVPSRRRSPAGSRSLTLPGAPVNGITQGGSVPPRGPTARAQRVLGRAPPPELPGSPSDPWTGRSRTRSPGTPTSPSPRRPRPHWAVTLRGARGAVRTTPGRPAAAVPGVGQSFPGTGPA